MKPSQQSTKQAASATKSTVAQPVKTQQVPSQSMQEVAEAFVKGLNSQPKDKQAR